MSKIEVSLSRSEYSLLRNEANAKSNTSLLGWRVEYLNTGKEGGVLRELRMAKASITEESLSVRYY